jgi:glycosyltransferase involved in cell wall biosynthesis
MKLSLSILIPCYNVETTVEQVIKNAYTTAKKVSNPLEIVIINDGSTDKTGKILSRLKKSLPCLRVITHSTNQGYGKTIKELYQTGKNEWLFSLPGDGQLTAEELLKLTPYIQKADFILGQRSHRRDPFVRRLQSKTYNWLLRVLFRLPIHDVNTIRLMKQSLIRHIQLHSDTAFVDAELAILAKRNGYRIIEIPVVHKKRQTKGATGGKILHTIIPTIVDMFRFVCCPA